MKEDIRARLLKSIDVKVKAVDQCVEPTAQAAQLLVNSLRGGHTVYLCGNGGSAADCQHLAAELVGRLRMERRGLPAIALTTDTSILTAVANDYDFENIFARQVEALVREGDVLIGISTSGSSINVVKAAAAARERKAVVIALTGEGGGKLRELADCLVAVPSTDTPRVQETHITLLHILGELVEKTMFPG